MRTIEIEARVKDENDKQVRADLITIREKLAIFPDGRINTEHPIWKTALQLLTSEVGERHG